MKSPKYHYNCMVVIVKLKWRKLMKTTKLVSSIVSIVLAAARIIYELVSRAKKDSAESPAGP